MRYFFKIDTVHTTWKPCVVLIVICFFKITVTSAQQDTQYTQYLYNTSTINPAYIGSIQTLSIVGLYRSQWVGIDGAPETINVNLNMPIAENMGAGLTASKETIGPAEESFITADFSYSIPLDRRYTQLSFGLKGGVSLLNIDYSLLTLDTATDLSFEENVDNRLSPVVGAGVYLNNLHWYAGISVPNLLSTTYFERSSTSTARRRPTLYAIGGYVFDLSRDVLLKPAGLLKITNGAPLAVDVSLNLLYNERLSLGVAYRFNAAVSLLAGFQITDQIMFGYSYDIDTTPIGNLNAGSHEIFLRFNVVNNEKKLSTPRFF